MLWLPTAVRFQLSPPIAVAYQVGRVPRDPQQVGEPQGHERERQVERLGLASAPGAARSFSPLALHPPPLSAWVQLELGGPPSLSLSPNLLSPVAHRCAQAHAWFQVGHLTA